MKMISLFIVVMIVSKFMFSQNADSATKKGSLSITGSVDAYYRYNFANEKDSMHTNNYTSFTNSHNSFELGMASLKADYTIGKVQAVADLVMEKEQKKIHITTRVH